MTIVLAAALVLTIVAFLIHLERKDNRQLGQVQTLLQRIQDPTAAVAQHVVQQTDYPVAHLPFDDDAAWRTHVEDLNGNQAG